jgi:hypothetical protein
MADVPKLTLGATDPGTEPVPGEDLPAVFSNRFYIVAGPQTTRIAFGENIDNGTSRYRSAVVMPMDGAKELVALLTDLIQKVEAQAPAAQAPAGRA